jgi:hypothetical protein
MFWVIGNLRAFPVESKVVSGEERVLLDKNPDNESSFKRNLTFCENVSPY